MGTVRASHEAPNLRAVLKPCATCKHWRPQDGIGDPLRGECTLLTDNDNGDAYVYFTEDAVFCCAHTFGCVLHEEKEAPSLALNG